MGNIGKLNDWMEPELFRILVVAIISSPTVYYIGIEKIQKSLTFVQESPNLLSTYVIY